MVTGYARTADGSVHATVWVPVEIAPIEQLLAEFDTAVDAGDLCADGGQGNLVAFRNKLTNVAKWLEDGSTAQACTALGHAVERIDGIPNPDDWGTGPSRAQFEQGLRLFAANLGCG